jgi:hypothetical protein
MFQQMDDGVQVRVKDKAARHHALVATFPSAIFARFDFSEQFGRRIVATQTGGENRFDFWGEEAATTLYSAERALEHVHVSLNESAIAHSFTPPSPASMKFFQACLR